MKKQIILAIAIVFVVMYLAFSFIEMQLNPFTWGEGVRFLYCLCFFLVSFIVASENNDKKKF